MTEDAIERLRKRKLREELHEKIRKGEIDIGPITKHTRVEEDTRDLRDPKALGEFLLDDKSSLSALDSYDKLAHLPTITISDYSGEPVDYSSAYQKELRERAAMGDRFAIALLQTGETFQEGE